MAAIKRKSEKTVATVSASSRTISVNVTERLTVKESKELRALLKEQEKVAESQAGIFDAFSLMDTTRQRYFGGL